MDRVRSKTGPEICWAERIRAASRRRVIVDLVWWNALSLTRCYKTAATLHSRIIVFGEADPPISVNASRGTRLFNLEGGAAYRNPADLDVHAIGTESETTCVQVVNILATIDPKV